MSYIEYARLQDFNTRFTELLEKESERGAGVIVICFLDLYLDWVLTEYFEEPESVAQLPTSFEKLPSRLKRLFLLGLATEDDIERFKRLRDVRNAFAHELPAENFRYPKIVEILGSAPEHARQVFALELQRCGSLLGSLLHARFDQRKKSEREYRALRQDALKRLSDVNEGFQTARALAEDANSLTYVVAEVWRYRIGKNRDRLSEVLEFWDPDGNSYLPSNSSSAEDQALSQWESTVPIHRWGKEITAFRE